MKLRRTGKEKSLVIENGAEAEVNAGLAAMITEAFAIRNELDTSKYLVFRGLGGRGDIAARM